MMREFIQAEEEAKAWMKDPEFVSAYAMEDEFAVASVLTKARGEADMAREQVAEPMGTTQAAVAQAMGTTRAAVAGWKVAGQCLRLAP